MDFQSVTTDRQLHALCRDLSGFGSIAVDTEFVSEQTYRPVLCLIQVAAGDRLAVIDPLVVHNLTPFWEALAAEGHETIVHAGRSEVEFCLEAVGRAPAGLFDVQIAAGMAGMEYPVGYGNLIARLLGETLKKHETRTDWRRRPLSRRQLDYAMDDVRYLGPIRDQLHARLQQLSRFHWLAEELTSWQEGIEQALTQERWRRVSGNSGLDARSLAVVRELWHWREAEAERRNRPVRQVLRDDLIVELARRRTADPGRIGAVRGLERGDLRRRVDELASCIRRALELPENKLPGTAHRERPPQLSVLGQFLFAALGSICREIQIAPNLVGTPNDIRDLIAYRTDGGDSKSQKPPQLAVGWRAEVVGRLFDDLLDGKTSIRVADPKSDHPLRIERRARPHVASD